MPDDTVEPRRSQRQPGSALLTGSGSNGLLGIGIVLLYSQILAPRRLLFRRFWVSLDSTHRLGSPAERTRVGGLWAERRARRCL